MSVETLQEEFNSKYITSSEICNTVQVTRPALFMARKNGKLPEAIRVENSNVLLWLRAEVEPFLQDWKRRVQAARGHFEGLNG